MKRTVVVLAALLASAACGRGERRGFVVFDSRTYETLDVAELGPCVTVDEGVDDNNALANLRGYLSNEELHGTAQGAIDNLNKCKQVTTEPLTIAGHGLEGTIITGGGNKIFDHQHISNDNDDQWGTRVDGLTRGTGRLTLLSCSTGGGEGGSLLLTNLARRTKRFVRARTQLSYFDTDKVYFEDGSRWNEVEPEKTAAIVPRNPPRYAPFEMPRVLTLGGTTFPIEQIDTLQLDFTLTGAPVSFTPTNAERNILLQMIDFAHPFTPPGEPLAPETARIVIQTKSGVQRTIIIYGNALARDAIDRNNFYDVDIPLTGLLLSWAQ